MDIEEMGLIPNYCQTIDCTIRCPFIEPELCPLRALAQKQNMDTSKSRLLKEITDGIKEREKAN